MKIKRNNFYGLDHKVVAKMFKGNLKYIGDYVYGTNYKPSAFYHAPKYDKLKGHKEYVFLTLNTGGKEGQGSYISGLTKEQAKEVLGNISGLWCLKCDTVIYSSYRHDLVSCGCKYPISVDGGKNYFKVSIEESAKFRPVIINLLNKKIRYKK